MLIFSKYDQLGLKILSFIKFLRMDSKLYAERLKGPRRSPLLVADFQLPSGSYQRMRYRFDGVVIKDVCTVTVEE